jgi:hypothetical protein
MKFRFNAPIIGAAALALLAVGPATASADPSSAHTVSLNRHIAMIPDTGRSCNPSILGDVNECTKVYGSGLHVSYLDSLSYFSDIAAGYTNLHIELYGPHGHIKNCSTFDFPAGNNEQSPLCEDVVNANVAPGNYCGRTWHYTGGGHWEVLSAACVDVHA